MDKIVDLFFNGLSIAGILIGIYLLVSGLNLKYVKTYFLKAWLVVILLQISFYLLNINEILPNNLTVNYFGFPLCMLHMPLFYLAIVDLTKNRTISFFEVLMHCLPYIAYVIFLIVVDSVSTQQVLVIDGFLKITSGLPFWVYTFIGIPLALSGFCYSIICIFSMLRYRRRLKENLSNTDKYQLNWVSYLVWTIVVLFILIYLVITIRTDFILSKTPLTFKLVNIFLFFFLLAFGVKYQQQLIYFIKNNVEQLNLEVKTKYSHSTLTLANMVQISNKLDHLMSTKKVYLDEYLTLQQVSELLNESTQNISQTFNEHLKTNFYNYVNGFRLSLAKKKLLDSEFSKLNIIGIAMDCGFKSKSTFYKLFKQKTGKTPSEYRNLG